MKKASQTTALIFLILLLPSSGWSMPAEAIQNLTTAIATAPPQRLHIYYMYRSKAYFNLGDYHKGLADLATSIQYNPTPEAYLQRGKFYQNQHRYEEAINDYSAALSLNRSFFPAYLLRSQAYYDNKEFNMALIDASYVKMYDDTNALANNIVEKCYINMTPKQKIDLPPNYAAIRQARTKNRSKKSGSIAKQNKKAKVAKNNRRKASCAPKRRSS